MHIVSSTKVKQIVIALFFFWTPILFSYISIDLLKGVFFIVMLALTINMFTVFLLGWYSIATILLSFLASLFIDNSSWYLDFIVITLGTLIYFFRTRISPLVIMCTWFCTIFVYGYFSYIIDYVNFYTLLESQIISFISAEYQPADYLTQLNYEILSGFFPFMMVSFIIVILLGLLVLSNFIASQFRLIQRIEFNFNIPGWYNVLWIILTIVTVFLHNFSGDNYNLQYSMYNIILIMLLVYVKAGYSTLFSIALKRDRPLVGIIGLVLLVIIVAQYTIYSTLLIALLGVLNENGVIRAKKEWGKKIN